MRVDVHRQHCHHHLTCTIIACKLVITVCNYSHINLRDLIQQDEDCHLFKHLTDLLKVGLKAKADTQRSVIFYSCSFSTISEKTGSHKDFSPKVLSCGDQYLCCVSSIIILLYVFHCACFASGCGF